MQYRLGSVKAYQTRKRLTSGRWKKCKLEQIDNGVCVPLALSWSHFRLKGVAQKRRCLSSLFTEFSRLMLSEQFLQGPLGQTPARESRIIS